jgi:ribonuclease P protein component
VLEGKARLNRPDGDRSAAAGPRFGFTVTKQIGNAVVRNRVKRRLRAALTAAATDLHVGAATDFDYVVIARGDAFACDFQSLVNDFRSGFDRVQATANSPPKPKPRGTKSRS